MCISEYLCFSTGSQSSTASLSFCEWISKERPKKKKSMQQDIFIPPKISSSLFPFSFHSSIHQSMVLIFPPVPFLLELISCISLVLFQQPSAYMSVVKKTAAFLDHFFIQTQPKGTRRQVCHLQCIKLQKSATSTIYELQINGNEKQHMGGLTH